MTSEIDIVRKDETFTLIVESIEDVRRILYLVSTRARRQRILAEAEAFFSRSSE